MDIVRKVFFMASIPHSYPWIRLMMSEGQNNDNNLFCSIRILWTEKQIFSFWPRDCYDDSIRSRADALRIGVLPRIRCKIHIQQLEQTFVVGIEFCQSRSCHWIRLLYPWVFVHAPISMMRLFYSSLFGKDMDVDEFKERRDYMASLIKHRPVDGISCPISTIGL